MNELDTLSGMTLPVVNGEDKEPKLQHNGLTVDVVGYNGNFDGDSANALPWFWRQLLKDGLLSLYFPEAPELSFPTFVKMFSHTDNFKITLVVLKDADGNVVKDGFVGFATLQPIALSAAMTGGQAGFIFLKDYWDLNTTLEAARKIEQNWFETDPELNILIGINPDKNRLVQMFMNRLQWTKVGSIPQTHSYKGELCASNIWYHTREQFNQEKP